MRNYFFELAKTVATASKDFNTKVGAIIVDVNGKVVSTGYNGMVAGCNEEAMWSKQNKHACVIHAEMNAALFSRRADLVGCHVYCTHAPCINCLKHLLQLGVRKFFYLELQTKTPLSPSAKDNLLLLIDSVEGIYIRNGVNGKNYKEELNELP